MAMLRISYMFNYSTSSTRRGAGWSESWYYPSSLPLAGPIRALLGNMAVRRSAMLPQAVSIVGYRATEVDDTVGSPGTALRSITVSLNIPGTIVPAHGNAAQDICQQAVLCQVLGTGTKNVRNFDMRGMIDDWFIGCDFTFDAAFTVPFNAYMSALQAAGFCFRGINLASPLVGIQSIDNTGLITTLAPMTWAAGSIVNMFRVRDTNDKPVKGSFVLKAPVTATTATLLNWKGQTVGQNGKVRVKSYTYPQIQNFSWNIQRGTVRKTGRPFGLFLGRRLVRR